MESPNDQKEDTDSDKINNCLEQCVLKFTCSYCGNKLDTFTKNKKENKYPLKQINTFSIINDDKCPQCKVKLSKCSVCSCPVKLSNKSNNECLVFCNKCSHGGHYEHYKGWFQEFNECPNSKCNCRCQQEDIIYS